MKSRYFCHKKKCSDIIGLRESFLGKYHPDSLISNDDFDFIRKDCSDVQKNQKAVYYYITGIL